MDARLRQLFAARDADDPEASYAALQELFALTDKPVAWAYEVWDGLVAQLTTGDNHQRAFAAQLLARLALSDPEKRILADLPAIAAVMRDERFVTARHTVQSIWRVGLAGPAQAKAVAAALEARFVDCAGEKNASLIRTDVMESLRRLAEAGGPKDLEARVMRLIESEPDEKAQKKQRTAWKRAPR